MTRKEALEIYKQEVIKFEGTRNTQWRFNISFWTLLVLGIFYSDKLKLTPELSCTAGILIFIGHFLFVAQTQYSLECSKILRNKVVDFLNTNDEMAVITLINKPSCKLLWEKSFFFRWIFFQMFLTIILILLFWVEGSCFY